jgi:carbamoyl-phosphate synthase large subunit
VTSPLVVLVTGAGGVYGEATVNNLRRSSLGVHILGADTRWHAPGSLCSDAPIVLPRVDDPGYVSRLIGLVRERSVNTVFVCSGTEIRALVSDRDRLERESGATFIMPSAPLYSMAADKLETVTFLASNGFAHPKTVSSQEPASWAALVDPIGFPLMAKPRFGQGSRGMTICRSMDDLTRIAVLDEEYVFQELLGDEDHEYTVGVTATESGEILASIVLRRWLFGGQTGACEVVDSPVIAEYAEAIAKAARPRGYINIQLRMRAERPVAFELNARVSSSTGFRALAGVNEPELILRRYVLKENPPRPKAALLKMVRGLVERIVDPSVWEQAVPCN